VPRACLVSLMLGAWAANALAPALVTANAAEPAAALACAKADLALIYRLSDEPHSPALTSTQLPQASVRMLDARSACRSGSYAEGIALYGEAEALAGTDSVSAITRPR
jgi:hypothetical protein